MAALSWAETECQAGTAPRVSFEGERTVVWLEGEQDIATVLVLAETLARVIAVDEAWVVVDLRAVSFIDAATIGVIIRGRNFMRQRSRELSVRSPSRCARRVLDVCGLSGLVDRAPAITARDPRPSAPASGPRSPERLARVVARPAVHPAAAGKPAASDAT